MPYRRRASYRRNMGIRPVIKSIKNVTQGTLLASTTLQAFDVAVAIDNPVTSTSNNVQNGCQIRAIWLSIDACGLAASGVVQRMAIYLIKNPGANLTLPGAFTTGTSNEKKFIIKQWQPMTMRNQDGNPPFHWEGWIKLPRRYHRMGTDDVWKLGVEVDSATGHFSAIAIYKWYT